MKMNLIEAKQILKESGYIVENLKENKEDQLDVIYFLFENQYLNGPQTYKQFLKYIQKYAKSDYIDINDDCSGFCSDLSLSQFFVGEEKNSIRKAISKGKIDLNDYIGQFEFYCGLKEISNYESVNEFFEDVLLPYYEEHYPNKVHINADLVSIFSTITNNGWNPTKIANSILKHFS